MSLEGRGFEVSKAQARSSQSLVLCFSPPLSTSPSCESGCKSVSVFRAMLATIFPAMTIYRDLLKL